MAIAPKDVYPPDQIDTGDLTSYPQGKAKNISGPGLTDGTPWERQIINDIFGFQQSILNLAGETPNGSPDAVNNAQYLAALFKILGGTRQVFTASGTWVRPLWLTSERIVRIQMVGGGGGGGGGAVLSNGQYAGGGGGSGMYRDFTVPAFEIGSDLTVTVGSGGSGSSGGFGSASRADSGAASNIQGTLFQQSRTIIAGGGAGGWGGVTGGGTISGLGGEGWNGGGGGGADGNSTGGKGGYGRNAMGGNAAADQGGGGGRGEFLQLDGPNAVNRGPLFIPTVDYFDAVGGAGGSGNSDAYGGGGGGPAADYGGDLPASLATDGAQNNVASGGAAGNGAGAGGGGGGADRSQSLGGDGGDGASGIVIITIL